MRRAKNSREKGFGVEVEAWRWLETRLLTERSQPCLLRRNFHCREGELDLIFLETREVHGERVRDLVIVEVRGRSRGAWVSGLETVTFPKRRKIERAARRFLLRFPVELLSSVRFDVLSQDGDSWVWVRDAWREGE
jgi:putative endonuclease